VQQQVENEAAYRQLLVQGVLAVLLPTEDLENDCLTALVGQIFSEMILGGGIGGKTSEPWLLWEGITKIAEFVKSQMPKSKAQARLDRSNSEAEDSAQTPISRKRGKLWRTGQSIQKSFWLTLQYLFVAFSAVRLIIVSLATSSSLPSRIAPTTKSTGPVPSKDYAEPSGLTNTRTSSKARTPSSKQPIVKMKIWSCVASLLDLETRMPWLCATLSMLQWGATVGPGGLGGIDGMIDK
jgi:hypothetical protein